MSWDGYDGDDYTVDPYKMLFPVHLTDSVQTGGIWYYTWKEQSFNASGYLDADSPRSGDKSTGPSFMVEVNNQQVTTPAYAWARLRGIVLGQPLFEFLGGLPDSLADDTHSGDVSTTAQTFAGTKTFDSPTTVFSAASGTAALTVDLSSFGTPLSSVSFGVLHSFNSTVGGSDFFAAFSYDSGGQVFDTFLVAAYSNALGTVKNARFGVKDGGGANRFGQYGSRAGLTISGGIITALADAPSVTGSRGGNAALASLLTQLAGEGLIVDNTTP
jgi:hypothetical protein